MAKIDIGKLIQSKLDMLEMSQTELAKILHVHKRTVSKWVNNDSSPDLTTFLEICVILHIDIQKYYHIHENKKDFLILSDKEEVEIIKFYRILNKDLKQSLFLMIAEIKKIYGHNNK